MKKTLTLLTIISIPVMAIAQVNIREDKTAIVPGSSLHSNNPSTPSPAFLTNVILESADQISREMENELWRQTHENIRMLRKKNPGACKVTSLVHPLFNWPTRAKASFTDYGYYTVNFLVDHDPNFPNHVLDYNCGSRTYDFGNGNHGGTDIILWPYAWRRMDEQVMEVIAAAPGVIVTKVDGNFDRNCANNGTGSWNSIFVRHDDGSYAEYLHFKSGSLTTKGIGDSVVTGEYLGTAGSSGSSDWPHLHFQVMDSNVALIDPWDGTCNSINAGDTWWQNQQPYNVPSINRICTKSTTVDYYNCPTPEITNEKDTFNIGDSLCLWLYTRDLELNSSMTINLYDPSMVNQINWNFTVPWATAPTSYVRWYYVVDAWWTQGWWTFETVYGGNSYQHQFYMTHSSVGLEESETGKAFSVYPNPAGSACTIKAPEKIKKLKLIDVTGKEIYSASPAAFNFNLQTSKFNNGIYFIEMKTENSITTKKLLIQH